MKKLFLSLALVATLFIVYSFTNEETKHEVVTISFNTPAMGKIQIDICEGGTVLKTDCKRADMQLQRATLINKYISQGYTLKSTNVYAVMIGSIYDQVENIYLER